MGLSELRFYLVNFYLWSRRRRLQRLHNIESAKDAPVQGSCATEGPFRVLDCKGYKTSCCIRDAEFRLEIM